MRKRKGKTKGKIELSKMFQKLKDGDKVCISRELSIPGSFPKRIEGKTGVINGKRGEHYLVKISDYNQEKVFIINPIHLNKIEIKK